MPVQIERGKKIGNENENLDSFKIVVDSRTCLSFFEISTELTSYGSFYFFLFLTVLIRMGAWCEPLGSHTTNISFCLYLIVLAL